MRFEHPEALWLLLLVVPALTAFLWLAWRRKRALILQFIQTRLLGNLTEGVSVPRQKLRLVLIALAVVCVMVALARPQWGFEWEEARHRGLDIVVAIDTSRSMLADDVSPNRIERAKLAALDLRKLAGNDRMGLVAFAGSAFLQLPLSIDEEAFRQSVRILDVNIIPQGGTALAEAIETALKAFKEKTENFKVLVVFTDGEDHDGRALEAARRAAGEDMRIFTVGIGTPAGELLRVPAGTGQFEFVKDSSGNVVKSRLNEDLLREIAQTTEGFYMNLAGANPMELLYERGLAPLPKAELSSRRLKRYHERFQWVLGLAIALLAAEMFVPERRRVRELKGAGESISSTAAPRALAMVVLCVLPITCFASPAAALKQYQAGNYEAALDAYERALTGTPEDARLRYNAGAAAFQAKDYQEALRHLESALLTEDLALQERAYYNLGNARYRMGEGTSELPAKQQAWERAVQNYESALKLDPADKDAKFNLEFVKRKLEELKKQQEQQQDKQEQKQDEQSQDEQQGQQKQEEQERQQQQSQDKQGEKQEPQPGQSETGKQDQTEARQGEQDKQEQQQAQQEAQQQESTEGKEGQSNRGQREGEQGSPEEQSEGGQVVGVAQMTPQQARQLLDSHRGEELPLIFLPEKPSRPQDRVFKDW